MIASSPWFWLALLIMALVIFGKGYDVGARHAREHAAAEQLEAVAQAHEQAAEIAKADLQTAQNYETARETVRTVYVKVKEKANANITKNPGYADCGLDADGLRLYNSHPGRTEDSTGGADSRVSGSAGRDGWETVDGSAKQHGTIADVLRLPSATQSLGGLVAK